MIFDRTKLFLALIVGSFVALPAVADEDQSKGPEVTVEKIETSKAAAQVLAAAVAENDPILFVAAGKLMVDLAPVAIVKEGVENPDTAELTEDDFWTASAVFTKAVEIAGAGSEIGKQAQSLADENKVEVNSEGCMGATHYHYFWYYDAWGNYVSRTVWHYC